MDPHPFFADPDPNQAIFLNVDQDPDPAIFLNVDQDPDPAIFLNMDPDPDPAFKTLEKLPYEEYAVVEKILQKSY